MKAVISSDWHGDFTTAGVSRFREVEAAAMHTAHYAMKEQAGLYIFAGDLAETEGPGMLRTIELAVRVATYLNTYHIRSLWLTGNHDVIEDGHRTSNLNPLRDVPGAVLADRPMLERYANKDNISRFKFAGELNPRDLPKRELIINVLALPFTPRTHDYDPAAFVREHAHEKVHLVVGHLMIEGIGAGSETRDMPRGRNVFLPVAEIKQAWPNAVIVQGHYHTQQVFNGVHVVGSLVRLLQVEAGNTPGFLGIDL